MIIARLDVQSLTVPFDNNGETFNSEGRACFDLSICDQPAAKITEQFVMDGSKARTAGGKIVRDITSKRRVWTLSYDYLSAEQLIQVKELYKLICAGHCVRFTIMDECECAAKCSSTSGTPEPVVVDIEFGSSTYSRWNGGRDGLTMTLEESACGGC